MKIVWNSKKIIIMCGAVLATIAIAVLAVFLVLNATKKAVEDADLSSYVSSDFIEVESVPVEEKQLIITSPTSLNTTVTTSKTVISGTSDIDFPLTMNGVDVERSADGSFSVDVDLKEGKNTFEFKHKNKP